MKWKYVLPSILVFGPLAVVSEAICQIPDSGADIPSLASVRWGMSMQEVKDRFGSRSEATSDSSMIFEDSFLDSKVKVVLTFGDSRRQSGLKSVEVQFADNNLRDKLLSYMKTRYGEKYEMRKQEKHKFFITINFETRKWVLGHGTVIMAVFSSGEEVMALSLLYDPGKE
jgi:hypothetical protein